MLWVLWSGFRMQSRVQLIEARDQKVQRMKSAFERVDDEMTMNANIAALTGDMDWVRRYRESQSRLTGALQRARRFGWIDGRFSPGAQAQDLSTDSLFDMEQRAFELIRLGRLKDARKILFSKDYEKQKEIYSNNIQWFTLANDQLIHFKSLWDDIGRYRIALNNSVRMAVLTAEPRWEKTYRSFEPKIYERILGMLQLSKEIKSGEMVNALQMSNFELMKLENKALDLVRIGQQGEAKNILSGIPYENNQNSFNEGMSFLASKVTQSAYPSFEKERRETVMDIALAGIVFTVILGLLLVVLFKTRRRTRPIAVHQDGPSSVNGHTSAIAQTTGNESSEKNPLKDLNPPSIS